MQIENQLEHGLINVIGHDMLHGYDSDYNTFLNVGINK